MSVLTVNNGTVELNGETNVLEIVRKAGIELPTLCYHPELTVHGSCRLCMVEIEGRGVVAACHTPPEAGMVIKTNTAVLRRVRKMALELLLARHNRECPTCFRTGNCKLQDLAHRFGISDIQLDKDKEKLPIDDSSIIVRDPNKCILCGECVRMCGEIQGIGVLDFVHRGSRMVVDTAFGQNLKDTECVHCGQCAAICPTGALVVRTQINEAWEAINDPDKTVVVQIAPAVRVSLGEEFQLPAGQSTLGQIAAALKAMGVEKVFDTSFAADVTVLEETEEFVGRIQSLENLPQFTSCCPAWVKYAEQFYPDFLPNLSSCRSPQQMLGAILKKHFVNELNMEAKDLYVISVMPCTAKKFEAAREEFTTGGVADVDLVLTTQELAHMIKEAGIDFPTLPQIPLDEPYGNATGAGIIFGVTGGVSEAVLRLGYEKITGENLKNVVFSEVRGYSGLRSCELKINGGTLRLAVVNGLANAKKVIEAIKNGEVRFDLIEVMACPGGCIGGGGQPITNVNRQVRQTRGAGLYEEDTSATVHKSQQNPAVETLYKEWLGKPGSEKAHEALHTTYKVRSVK